MIFSWMPLIDWRTSAGALVVLFVMSLTQRNGHQTRGSDCKCPSKTKVEQKQ